MNEQIELCFKAMRFTPLLGIIDLLLILHFCISWYLSARRTGWKIDFWYLTLFLGAFQSLLVLYPFNASVYNSVTTLGQIERISPFVDRAFLISILGYSCIWMGRFTYDLTQGKFPFIAFFQFARPLAQMMENNVKNKASYLLLTVGTLFLGLIVLGIQFAHGEYFNGRRFFLASPAFRPLFNATISLFPIVFTFIALRFSQYKEKSGFKFFILLSVISLCFGIRSLFIGGLLCLWTMQAFQREGRVKLKKLAFLCLFFFSVAILLTNLREGNYNPLVLFGSFFFNFFYGNNFSDTRDFAWVLSYWDGEHLYGKSYIAALLSFIPRSLITLRQEWGISMYTNAMLGFSSDVMPGLRPGLSGEAYFNFGLPGVVLFGWFFGFALRYTDMQIKKCVYQFKDLIKGYSHLIVYSFISCLAVSAGMWGFYMFILVNFALVPFRLGRGMKRELAGGL